MPLPLDDWDEADARGESAWRPPVGGVDDTERSRTHGALDERERMLVAVLEGIEKQIRPGEGAQVQYGKRIGDHTTDAVEARRGVAAADTIRIQLVETRRALAKLADGTYGRCDSCGKPIGLERLEALPWAGQCVVCRVRKRRQ